MPDEYQLHRLDLGVPDHRPPLGNFLLDDLFHLLGAGRPGFYAQAGTVSKHGGIPLPREHHPVRLVENSLGVRIFL